MKSKIDPSLNSSATTRDATIPGCSFRLVGCLLACASKAAGSYEGESIESR